MAIEDHNNHHTNSPTFEAMVQNPFKDFKDFPSQNLPLTPSPMKVDFRNLFSNSNSNSVLRKPFESPFVKFVEALSPLQSRIQTPLSHFKNLNISSE